MERKIHISCCDYQPLMPTEVEEELKLENVT